MNIFKEEAKKKPKQIFGKGIGKDIFAITLPKRIEKYLGIDSTHYLYDILRSIALIRIEPPKNCRCSAFVGEKNGKKNQVTITIRFSNINKRMRVDILEINDNKNCPKILKKTILEKLILSIDKMGLGDKSSKSFLEYLKEM